MVKEAKIALGTWSWGIGGTNSGNVVFGNQLDTKDLEELFKTALNSGLNLFDTAYAYALGESERILGELISNVPRESVVISDKFTPEMHDKNSKTPMLDMLNGSLARLKTDYIDIYWIHNSSDIEKWTPILADMVLSGNIGRIGVSNHNLSQVKRVQEILVSKGVKLAAVQNHFSLLYRESIDSGLLDYCKNNNIQFFSYMVLEQGTLSGKYDQDNLLPKDSKRGKLFNPLFPKISNLLKELRVISEKYNASPAQIATAWAIAKGTTPILGVTKLEQVKEATQTSEINLERDEIISLEQAAISANVNTFGGWEGKA